MNQFRFNRWHALEEDVLASAFVCGMRAPDVIRNNQYSCRQQQQQTAADTFDGQSVAISDSCWKGFLVSN